jgi:polyhydroxybutyrate depolymerase
MMRAMRPLLICALVASGACSSSPPKTSPLVMARPYGLDVPDGWFGDPALPLIVLLHGYGTTGFSQEAYFGFNRLPDARKMLVAYPDGTVDSTGSRFWNADDACCNFDHSPVDDVAYINAVIDDVEAKNNVDKHHIFVAGHSNGGFMAHRLACDSTRRIAAIAALAGDVWKDPSKCNPAAPIAVLQVHGDADTMVPYDGKDLMPSAHDSVATWAAKNGCSGGLQPTGRMLDLDASIPGSETRVDAWSCPAGAAELWTIQGGSHEPMFKMPDWANDVADWLMGHSR